MIVGVLIANGAAYNLTGVAIHTPEQAKAAVAQYLNTNKASFTGGYDAFVLDTDKGTVVSCASAPKPTLAWKDAQ